jgi:hypothetical protein
LEIDEMFFSRMRGRRHEAQSLLFQFLNGKVIVEVKSPYEDRSETRSRFCLAVSVIPLHDGDPDIDAAFTAVTKDISTTGVGIVTNQLISTEEVLIFLGAEASVRPLRAKVCSCHPLGFGWFVFGTEVTALAYSDEYPILAHFDPNGVRLIS